MGALPFAPVVARKIECHAEDIGDRLAQFAVGRHCRDLEIEVLGNILRRMPVGQTCAQKADDRRLLFEIRREVAVKEARLAAVSL